MKTLLPAAAAAALLAFQAPAFAEDLEFLLINDSSADLVEFNVSPASSSNWEDNLMDGGYLAPGYEIGVVIADGATTCVYDIRGSFDDGSEAEDFGLDLCDLGEYTFTD
ncbi:hypothetical protein K3555_08155 [Leisingera sp. M527]|uniref:hypothetical protein n=1 Tax=unclassified Leisingera TaxID=2614906 RepID=UPI000B26DCCB|nr:MULTISPECIES: hypothetical protein [unclassified Leisingera]UWQ30347.1 hypothetical protein K3557_07390 [Leisingera sp. M523]UWQ34439.1 hypothetical protein K3555_08155 [Leisingera sp. M527]UWQ76449.1 hypothetical protein K3724_08485 [Leisingera sp. M658]